MKTQQKNSLGNIEVICGPMFGGKSTKLRERVIAYRKTGKRSYKVFKHASDVRSASTQIVTHSRLKLTCTPVWSMNQIPELVNGEKLIAIDEGQFFRNGLVNTVSQLAGNGAHVVIACLKRGYNGEIFSPEIAQLLKVADTVTEVTANCVHCGQPAEYHRKRKVGRAGKVIGGADLYEAVCEDHFKILNHSYTYIKSVIDNMLEVVVDTATMTDEHVLALNHIAKCEGVRCKQLFKKVHGHSRDDSWAVLLNNGKAEVLR